MYNENLAFCNGSASKHTRQAGVAFMFTLPDGRVACEAHGIDYTTKFEAVALFRLMTTLKGVGLDPKSYSYHLQNGHLINKLVLEGYSVGHISRLHPYHAVVHRMARKARETQRGVSTVAVPDIAIEQALEGLTVPYWACEMDNQYVIRVANCPIIYTPDYDMWVSFLSYLAGIPLYRLEGGRGMRRDKVGVLELSSVSLHKSLSKSISASIDEAYAIRILSLSSLKTFLASRLGVGTK